MAGKVIDQTRMEHMTVIDYPQGILGERNLPRLDEGARTMYRPEEMLGEEIDYSAP